MPEVNRILAAICFSDYCNDTFTYATRLAMQLQAELIVANVINIKDVQAVGKIEAMGYSVSSEDYVKGVEEERSLELEQMVAKSGFAKDRIKLIFKVGHPFQELIKLVEEEDVDLVVLGPKGRSDHSRLLVGSVAEKMSRHSPVSVVIYRKKKSGKRS
jgi:nucleotide-binding universal stress UspA family protein